MNRRTKQRKNTPQVPKKSVKDGYWWLFGDSAPPGQQEAFDRQEQKRRIEEDKRRVEGFEWFFL